MTELLTGAPVPAQRQHPSVPATAPADGGDVDARRGRELMVRWCQELAPRPKVRMADAAVSGTVLGGDAEPGEAVLWLNHYGSDAHVLQVEPGRPAAMVLTRYSRGGCGVLVYLVFDLDAKLVGPEQVAVDEERLRELLRSCGIAVVAATSGPGGGRHLWTSCPQGLPWDLVERIAAAAGAIAPSLDWGSTMSERWNVAARPPGAPHRAGGRSRLDVEDERGIAEAIAVLRTGTGRAAFRLLADRLTAEAAAMVPNDCVPAIPRPRVPARPRFGLVSNAFGRIVSVQRPRRPSLSPATLAALGRELEPGDDHSAQFARVITLLILAGYTLADVQLLAVTAPGLEGLRTQRVRAGSDMRVAYSDAQRDEMTARQYDKLATFVAGLPAPAEPRLDTGPADESRLRAELAVGYALELADAEDPDRWGGGLRPSGPADYAVLSYALYNMIRTGLTDLELPTRAVGRATGRHHDTAARSLWRHDKDAVYLVRSAESSGPHGARYRLADHILAEADARFAALLDRAQVEAEAPEPSDTPETAKAQVNGIGAAQPRPFHTGPTQEVPPPPLGGGQGGSGGPGFTGHRTVICESWAERTPETSQGGEWETSAWSWGEVTPGQPYLETQDHERRDQDQVSRFGARSLLQRRMAVLSSEVFAHGTGQDDLGRHCAYVLIRLMEHGERERAGIEANALADLVGQRLSTVLRHLRALQKLGLVGYSSHDGGWFATGVMPDEVDAGRGAGIADRRAQAHKVDAIRWAWWRSEVAFLQKPRDAKRAAVAAGQRGSAWQEQLITDPDADPAEMFTRLRYPRRTVTTVDEDGTKRIEHRPDHAEAAVIIRWHLHQAAEAAGSATGPAPAAPRRPEAAGATWTPGNPADAPSWAV